MQEQIIQIGKGNRLIAEAIFPYFSLDIGHNKIKNNIICLENVCAKLWECFVVFYDSHKSLIYKDRSTGYGWTAFTVSREESKDENSPWEMRTCSLVHA